MAKRFTDTGIWDKEWFMALKPRLKCLVKYVRDKCDVAGVWDPNWTLANAHIGEKVTLKELLSIDNGRQFLQTNEGKIFCIGFVNFQYGETLNEKSPVHKKILDILKKYYYGEYTLLDTLSNRVLYTPKEEDIEKEEEEDMEEEEEKERGGVGGKPAEEVKLVLKNPFSDEFMIDWALWKKYKSEQLKFTYKSIISEQAAINDLVKISKGDEVTAIAIIHQSIAKGWKGFFELKDANNGHSKTPKQSTGAGVSTASAFAKIDTLFSKTGS